MSMYSPSLSVSGSGISLIFLQMTIAFFISCSKYKSFTNFSPSVSLFCQSSGQLIKIVLGLSPPSPPDCTHVKIPSQKDFATTTYPKDISLFLSPSTLFNSFNLCLRTWKFPMLIGFPSTTPVTMQKPLAFRSMLHSWTM